MTFDDRLRSAHQQRLREEEQRHLQAGSPGFVPSAGNGKTAVLLAAACLALVAFLSYAAFDDRSETPEVRLDIASIPPETNDGAEDGPGVNPQRVDAEAATPTATPEPTATTPPTPTPSPTPTPTPTSAPSPTPTPDTATADPGESADADLVQEPDGPSTDDAAAEPGPDPTRAPADDAAATPTAVVEGGTGPAAGADVSSATATATAGPVTVVVPTSTPDPVPTSVLPTTIAEPTASPTTTPTSVPEPTPTTQPTPEQSPTVQPTAVPTATPQPTSTPVPTATPPATATATPTATPTPEPTATPTYDQGAATTVCPSGRRASLERSTQTYTSALNGWGGSDHLVDEQNGPYYFQAWEPNFPDLVSVEVALDGQVLATDIRVFQDPFTPVAGEVEIVIGSTVYPIVLSGVDGWRVATFAEPMVLDRFEITRDATPENIMEVMICLAP